jgi:hypothetical protein
MTEILRFEMNVPAEVALKYAGPGKPIEGRYGNRVMYTLADNRVMYVAPIVANRISDLGIQPGEVFQVCKQEKKQGQRKVIEWQVQRLASEPETQLEQDLRESIEVAQAARATQPSEALEEPNPQPPPAVPESDAAMPPISGPVLPVAPVSNGHVNGTASLPSKDVSSSAPSAPTRHETRTELGDRQKQPVPCMPAPVPTVVPISNGAANGSPSPAPKNGNTAPPVTTKLEHALKTAISAAHNAEKFGTELGYVVRFDADAIKSMAITVLINMSEGGRR